MPHDILVSGRNFGLAGRGSGKLAQLLTYTPRISDVEIYAEGAAPAYPYLNKNSLSDHKQYEVHTCEGSIHFVGYSNRESYKDVQFLIVSVGRNNRKKELSKTSICGARFGPQRNLDLTTRALLTLTEAWSLKLLVTSTSRRVVDPVFLMVKE